MFQRILVPLDGSTRAEEALLTAAHIARATNASLLLVRAVLPAQIYASVHPLESEAVTGEVEHSYLEQAGKYLTQVSMNTCLKGIQVAIATGTGSPGDVIIQIAKEHQIDLIIMRSHGQTGILRWLCGSVAQYVIRHSPIPVLVMRDGNTHLMPSLPLSMHVPRLLIALDGSRTAEEALVPAAQFAHALARPDQGKVHLTCVVRHVASDGDATSAQIRQQNKAMRAEAEGYLSTVAERFRSGDLAPYTLSVTFSVVTFTHEEDIWKRLLEESECIGDVPGYSGCDIIAMVTHGRTGLQHLLHGSVTEHVLDATHHPLLVLHGEAKAKESANLSL